MKKITNFLKNKFDRKGLNDITYLAHLPQWSVSQPPMGISYVASYLISKGHKVKISDFSIEFYSELPEDKRYLLDNGAFHINWIDISKYEENIESFLLPYLVKWKNKILEERPKLVGFSVLTTNVLPSLWLAENIKKENPDIKIIFGGPYAARYDGAPHLMRQDFIDFIVPEEGEEVCEEVTSFVLKNDTRYEKIKGLLFNCGNGEFKDTGKREMISDINTIPFPHYTQFPLEKYIRPAIPLLGSRGCIFSCTFCSETVLWKKFRYRTAENMVAEIEEHLDQFPTCNYFYIVDSLINGNMKELIKMCEMIIEKNLDVAWGGKASIRTQMTKEVLELMAKAGCKNLQYGIESGSPKVVRDMRKGFTIPIAKRVLKDSSDVGIRVGCFFLVGFPTETEEDYELTKNFIEDVEPYLDEIIPGFGMGLLPGSEVNENPEKFGIVKNDYGGWHSENINATVLNERVRDFRTFCSNLNVSVSG